MIDLALQLDPVPAPPGFPILLVVTLIAMVLGLFITFQAYRGYRRNVSRPLLFLALGIALLTVVPFAFSIILTAVGSPPGTGFGVYLYWLGVATRLCQTGGLICILYSLHIRH